MHRWSIFQRPLGSTTNLTGPETANPTLPFSSDHDIGTWRIQLDLDDNEGERKTFTHDITVPNVPPNISINGSASIDVLQPINLQVTPTTDVDGGTLDIAWDILQSPPGASVAPQSNFRTGPMLTLTTTEADIGTWRFRATARDNENATDTADLVVEVNNLPPDLDLVGEHEIDVGETIQVETTIVDDADGGLLAFQWDVVQAPQSSAITVQESFTGGTGPAGSLITIPTSFADAGTWILRLKATDNDNAANSEVSEEFIVVVDAPPSATITGPATIGSLSFPLELSADTSVDPDSPCVTQSDRCHDTLAPPVRSISRGIVSYSWSLIDVPFELWDRYPLGAIDEVFGQPAHSSIMSLDFGDIEPGEWTFQVQVVDGEGNEDFATFVVTVVNENGNPTAIVSEPGRYLVNISGQLTQNVGLSGNLSFDLDNLLSGSIGPGVGITNYQWDIVESPSGCAAPALPSGPTQSAVTLFTAGVINPACQGLWRIRLTVTDDDTPAKTGIAETTIIIGNCPQAICIDYPTNLNPQFVEFVEGTDIQIYYHLDSTLYDNPGFQFGMFTILEIFHESDLTTPVFTSTDPNVLASNKGGNLIFNWNGYSDRNERPLPGLYTIRITPVDSGLVGVTGISSTELNAIWIAVSEPEILSTSDRYQNFKELDTGTGQLDINYQIHGGAVPDQLRWRIRDASNSVIFETTAPPAGSGTISWDGQIAGSTIPTGFYSFELEALRGSASLGMSAPHAFVIYKLDIKPNVGAASSTRPGEFVFVNNDDDNRNNVSDLNEVAAGENDLVQFNITVEPAIAGVVTLSSSTAPPPFKLWNTAAKGVERTLPATFNTPAETVPPQLFVEGQTAAQSDIQLQLQTTDGVTLGPVTAALTTVDVQIMLDTNNDHSITAADTGTFNVRIARWDGAYDAAFAVNNAADPANFVERDTLRFYLRVRNPFANADPATAEQVTLGLGTITGAAAVDDDQTDITLVETGVNTGEFVSRSQILTSHDIQVNDDANADDELKAHDGSIGIKDDDVAGDRTHRAEIDGAMRLQYQPGGPPSLRNWDVPVCQRSPEARRKVQIRVHVFREPFQDVGLDGIPGTADLGEANATFDFTDTNGNAAHDVGEASEPYMDLSHGGTVLLSGAALGVIDARGPVVTNAQVADQLSRTDIAWAPACVKTEQVAILIEDAPKIMGVDILLDGSINLPAIGGPDDLAAINTAFSAVMVPDVVELFIAAPITGANAISLPPISNGLIPTVAHGETSFIVQAPNLPINFRTLAHEMGHILTNQTHSAATQVEFFPLATGPSPAFNDGFINIYRRLTFTTETNARTIRPAGNLVAIGNSLLKLP